MWGASGAFDLWGIYSMKLKFIAAAAASLAAIAMTAGLASADDIYLKGTDITGDSKVRGREGQVLIVAMSEGLGSVLSPTTGARAGKVTFSDIMLSKFVDSSSAKFRELALTGKRIPSVDIETVKKNQLAQMSYKITLKNVLVTSVMTSASGENDKLSEDISLAFDEIVWSIPKVLPDGRNGDVVTFGWNAAQNKRAQ